MPRVVMLAAQRVEPFRKARSQHRHGSPWPAARAGCGSKNGLCSCTQEVPLSRICCRKCERRGRNNVMPRRFIRSTPRRCCSNFALRLFRQADQCPHPQICTRFAPEIISTSFTVCSMPNPYLCPLRRRCGAPYSTGRALWSTRRLVDWRASACAPDRAKQTKAPAKYPHVSSQAAYCEVGDP